MVQCSRELATNSTENRSWWKRKGILKGHHKSAVVISDLSTLGVPMLAAPWSDGFKAPQDLVLGTFLANTKLCTLNKYGSLENRGLPSECPLVSISSRTESYYTLAPSSVIAKQDKAGRLIKEASGKTLDKEYNFISCQYHIICSKTMI